MQAEVNILSGTSPCPSARPGGSGGVVLICSLGRGWARVSGSATGLAGQPRARVLLPDLGAAGLHPAGVFGTQYFSKALLTLGLLPLKVRPEEQ